MQFPFFKTRDAQKNFFLALLIKPYKVGAILFEEINGKLFILSTDETSAGGKVSDLPDEELLLAIDKVISFVEGSIPASGSVEKTIFSVPYDFVEEGKIKREYLTKLKKVCDSLGLVPMGYLTSIEAMISFLQHQEGAPVSALFVEIGEQDIIIYLVRAGKVLETHSESSGKDVLKTVENVFSQIESVDVLPSKIILLDYKGAGDIHQDFLSHPWPREIPFLHIPQVVVLSRGFENEATINGVASQMELEVLQDIHAEAAKPLSGEILEETDGKDFGFLKEKDVALNSAGPQVLENVKAEDQSIGESQGQGVPGELEGTSVKYFKGEEKDDSDREEEVGKSVGFLSFVKNLKLPFLQGIFSFQEFFKGGGAPFKIKLALFASSAVIFLFLLLFIYYNLILRAEITIFADKKAIDKTTDVVFQENATLDSAIPIELFKKEVKGQDTKNSTGKKETGDKARGELVVYNKTDQKKAFPKGTILIGPNDLEFVLDSEINIASTSPFSTNLSSARGKVLAAKIGREYNLASNSNFTVKGFSSAAFIAKNSEAIIGGTKKETVVVSKVDLDDLLNTIVEKLERQAISKTQGEITGDEVMLEKALAFRIAERKYTKKEGEESKSVGIEATISFDLGKYKKQDLEKFLERQARGEVPGTYTLLARESKADITNIKVDQKNKSASATLAINAIYVPKIEVEKLALALKGKNSEEAKKQIESIPGITDVAINLKNKLPFFPQSLPNNSKNILIQVKN